MKNIQELEQMLAALTRRVEALERQGKGGGTPTGEPPLHTPKGPSAEGVLPAAPGQRTPEVIETQQQKPQDKTPDTTKPQDIKTGDR
jgi:hypothetical protein